MDRTEAHDNFSSPLFKFRRDQTCFFHKFNHLERAASPLLNDATTIEYVSNQIITELGGMWTCKFLNCNSGRKRTGIGDLKSIIKYTDADRASSQPIIPMTQCVRDGFSERLHRVERLIFSLYLIGKYPARNW